MKLTPSISSAAKLVTLSMALLAVLSIINTPAVHAAPISNAGAPLVNGVERADPETSRVPVGPRGPLLNRRGSGIAVSGGKETSGLGKTHPSAIEKPDPSGSAVSMRLGHATKRDDDEEMWESLGKARWMQKRDETTPPARGKWKDVGVIKRSDPALDEKRRDDPGWSLISKPNVFPAVAVTKRGDGKDEAPESIWREWNGKGGAAGRFEVKVVMTPLIEGKGKGNGAAKKRRLKTEQKKRNVDDSIDAAGAAAGSQKKDMSELETLEKRKFRTWHFKHEE
ncbi:hypothetical protein EC957_007959 [Mortierella hygrophila]|uniref:Uncharacterized protein n=1 Tax=Mortierella hygrophila TaxID=979708 RepID=A0A9P6EWK0_9FUNG|nr:hypothetical protein EC957_007959 [Mortierella hygrophila]